MGAVHHPLKPARHLFNCPAFVLHYIFLTTSLTPVADGRLFMLCRAVTGLQQLCLLWSAQAPPATQLLQPLRPVWGLGVMTAL